RDTEIELTISNRYHSTRRFTDVIRARADNAVVGALFHHVRRPASQARAHENRREQFGRNAHVVIGRRVEKVGVTEQFLLAPHHRFATHGNVVQVGVAVGFGQFFAPLFDHGVTRIRLRVDGVTEAHDFLFTRQHAQQAFFGVFRIVHAFNQSHRCFVSAAVQRATQRADGTGDGGVHIAQGGGTHAGGEGGGVEFVFGVQNQGSLHYLGVQLGRFFTVQRPQELFSNGVGTGFHFNALTVVAEVVPVVDHAREQRQHAVGGVLLLV